jgi:hypothetical protein
MNKGTKQLLLVGGSLIVLGGIIYYFIKKGRDTGGEIMDETIEQAVDSTKPEVKTKPQGTPVSKAGKYGMFLDLDTYKKKVNKLLLIGL